MLKQLVITIALISFLGTFAFAQEKTETGKKEKQQMEHMQKDSNKDMHHNMKMDNSKEKTSAEAWNKLCPVRGGEVNPEVATVEYNGKEYGFCCGGCDSKFAKDPEKYSKNLNEDGTEFIGKK